MPYDPRMMQQIGRMGIGMMGPQQGASDPFAAAPRPKQWWEGLPPMGAQQKQDDPNAPSGGKPPASLLDMLMASGGKGTAPSSYGPIPGMGAASPWMYLSGLMGGGGGAGK